MESAGFWMVSGCGVPLCLFHIVPVKNILVYLLFIYFFSPQKFQLSCLWYATVSIRFMYISVWTPNYIFSILTRYFSVVWICIASSSGFVWTGAYLRCVRSSHKFVFRFSPAFLRQRHHRLLLPYPCLSFSGLALSLVFRLICPEGSHPSGHFSGGFNFNISSTFSSFDLISFSSISCPSHFVWLMKNSEFFLLLGIPLSPLCLECQIISFRDLLYFPGLRRLCHLTMPVCCILSPVIYVLEYCGYIGKTVKSFLNW